MSESDEEDDFDDPLLRLPSSIYDSVPTTQQESPEPQREPYDEPGPSERILLSC